MGTHIRRVTQHAASKHSGNELICAVATRLDEARVSQNMKIETLAYKSGVPDNEIARLLRVEVNPRISTVSVLAQTLGIDMPSILGCKEMNDFENNSEFVTLLQNAEPDTQRAVISLLRGIQKAEQ